VVSFPDVGQGDCALVELSGGETILIDGGGTRDNRFDIGRRVLAPFLWNKGIRKLDLVVLSHPHPDHMNGLVAILKKFEVASVWESGLDPDLPGYDVFRQTMRDRNICYRQVSADDPPSSLGEARLRVLHPHETFVAHDRQAYAAENNRSLVVEVTSKGKTLLFTGDIGMEAEQDIMRTTEDLKTDLIKVPHHGSKSSSSRPFIERTRPKIAIVTVGAGNLYHHPAETVVNNYSAGGATVYRTDTGGALRVTLKNNHFEIIQWKERILKRIAVEKSAEWKACEQENLRRLTLRAAAL
jgi:competence protein ComEC